MKSPNRRLTTKHMARGIYNTNGLPIRDRTRRVHKNQKRCEQNTHHTCYYSRGAYYWCTEECTLRIEIDRAGIRTSDKKEIIKLRGTRSEINKLAPKPVIIIVASIGFPLCYKPNREPCNTTSHPLDTLLAI